MNWFIENVSRGGSVFLHQFADLLVLILIVAIGLSLIGGEYVDAAVIFFDCYLECFYWIYSGD